MKQPIRYFSLGLLTASIIILIIVSFFDRPNTQVNEWSIDEMIENIKDEGYYVLSSSEYISLSVGREAVEENTNSDETENSTKEDENEENQDTENNADNDETNVEEEPEIYEYTLTIEPNMLGPTVSQLLKENNIIEDADAFNRYLELEGYAPYLQLGDHELTSDMTQYEIAEIIARTR